MTALLIVLVIMAVGITIARMAWVRLSAEERDVLHTHPKLVVALIVSAAVILSVQTIQANFVLHLVDLVEEATSPKGAAAKQQVYVVAGLEATAIAAAHCAQGHDDVEQIKACTVTEVERLIGQPPVIAQLPTTTSPGG